MDAIFSAHSKVGIGTHTHSYLIGVKCHFNQSPSISHRVHVKEICIIVTGNPTFGAMTYVYTLNKMALLLYLP